MTVWPNGLKTRPRITSPYGYSAGYDGFHYGTDFIDFDLNRAVMAGQVIFAGWSDISSEAGIEVRIRHANGDVSRYLHNAQWLVSRDEWVAEGQSIGVQGRTGATGKHLHFEIWLGGSRIRRTDPVPYIQNLITSGAGGGGTIIIPPTIQQEAEDDMIPLYVTDSVDGNNIPGWALLNPRTGKLITMKANNESWATLATKQGIADSWGRVWGNARHVTRLDMLNAVDAIKKTA